MSFISGAFGGGDAKRAAEIQQQGYQQAGTTLRTANAEANNRFNSYLNLSNDANNRIGELLNGDYSSFYTSPDYQFRLQEGLDAVQNSGSAQGLNLSGAQLQGLNNYAQGFASQAYGDYYNRLAGLRGEGLGITGQQASNDLNTARGVADTQIGAAGARASGYLANANIKNAFANNVLNIAANAAGSRFGNPSAASGGSQFTGTQTGRGFGGFA